jgi:oxygen-independent coproporphyrinogen-3 oxidase
MCTPLALYLHIPFCAARCHYCDFNTYAGLEALFEPYTAALVEEIRRAGAARGRPPVRTIFIGGGTPTVLPADLAKPRTLLARALAACREAFGVAADAEITSEANPGTVDRARFTALREMGVNRLSLGVQSFDDTELRWLGRIHSAAEAEAAFAAARAAGFANVNLDFIYGLPGQDRATWAATLARGGGRGPPHHTQESPTGEHGTPLARHVRRGLVALPDDDLAADLYELACDTLAAGGYEQYEISNWTRAGRQKANGKSQIANRRSQFCNLQSAICNQCRHNLVYWRREPYLGFGAGAHSFDRAASPRENERRWWNVRSVPAYIRRVEAGKSPAAGRETIDRRLAMGETMMLGLRLVVEGVPDERFRARFGVGPEDVFGAEIRRLVAQGLLERLPDRVRLTARGRLLGNRVFAEFLPGE